MFKENYLISVEDMNVLHQNRPEFITTIAIKNPGIASIRWLVYLSKTNDFLFNDAFDKIIKNPNDLYMFVETCRKSDIRYGLGRKLKRSINTWLHNNATHEWGSEYKEELRQVIRLTRPNFKDDAEFQTLIQYILS